MSKLERKFSKSDRYQHLFNEISWDFSPGARLEGLGELSNSQSITARLSLFAYSEELLDLQDQLKERFWYLAKQHCTERQLKVMLLLADGYTQTETAKVLGCNQTSIYKSWAGNGTVLGQKTRYGGAMKKLQKVMARDAVIQDLLVRIQEAKEEIL